MSFWATVVERDARSVNNVVAFVVRSFSVCFDVANLASVSCLYCWCTFLRSSMS